MKKTFLTLLEKSSALTGLFTHVLKILIRHQLFFMAKTKGLLLSLLRHTHHNTYMPDVFIAYIMIFKTSVSEYASRVSILPNENAFPFNKRLNVNINWF